VLLPDIGLITPYYLGAYNKYVKATGAVLDSDTGFLRITNAQYEGLWSLYFVIGGKTFELTRNAQIYWRYEEFIYLAVKDMGTTHPGVDFVCGMAFLERFYSVFDSGNRRVGFARTQFTNATTN
jgi:cathepsin E